MKLKTTINGKRSTVVGTPAEVAEFLEVARKKAIRRAVDALPRTVKLGEGEPVMAHFNGRLVERKTGPIHVKDAFKPTFNAISQTREEIVKEAIADVAELLKGDYYFYADGYEGIIARHVGSSLYFVECDDRVDFFVDKGKRKVTARVFVDQSTGTAEDGDYATTGIARCAPSDVFNEHVCKAIALRRALGLPVPTKYYEVGDKPPEGKQVGDVVHNPEFDEVATLFANLTTEDGEAKVTSGFAKESKVIDDSARYVAPSTPAAKVVYVD